MNRRLLFFAIGCLSPVWGNSIFPQEKPSQNSSDSSLQDCEILEQIYSRCIQGESDSFLMNKQGLPQRKSLWKRWTKDYCAQNTLNCTISAPQPTEVPTIPPSELGLPSGRLCPPPSPGGIFCNVSGIIWQSKMWGLEFAGKSTSPTNLGTNLASLEEKVFVPDFAWRPGFKLDLGFDFDFDGWDLDSRWTYYRGESTHLKKHIDLQINPPGMGVVPLWLYPFYNLSAPSQIRFLDSRASWRHYFNSIDLEIGRLSALSKRIVLHLFTGLKGAWMHQYYRVEYDQGSLIEAILPGVLGSTPFSLLTSTSTFKNKTWGGGPRVGFDTRWKLGCGFSILGSGAFSLLYSKIETSRNQNDLNRNTTNNLITPFSVHITTNSHQLKPVAETKLGLDWQTCIHQRSLIEFTVAYELQYFWAQNALRRNYSHAQPGGAFPMRGDLQMHGLTATAGYHY